MTDLAAPDLERLFFPRSIAVVGASPKTGMRVQGNNYIKGSVELNFSGKIYPVHPKAKTILGFDAYARVRDIPGDVDLVIFSIPAKNLLPVVEDCVAKRVRFIHSFTAGFSETGIDEFADLEKKLLAMVKESGIRLVGPNCMGVYCPEGGLSFQPFFPQDSGPVGFFSQSGQLAGMFVMKGAEQGLRFSKVVSFGNASDLKAHEFLAYLGEDDKTKVIGSYLEGLKDGREFFEVAKKVTRTKPLVVYKGGQTEGGSRATRSHTAAVAGSYRIWKAVCRQTGIIPVDSLDELACTLSALQGLDLPQGNRAAILGGAGGGSVTMTDIAEKGGLSVPHLAPETIAKLREIVPPEGTSVKNPLDTGFATYTSDNYLKLIDLLRDDPMIDALIFLQPAGMFYRMLGRGMARAVIDQSLEARKRLGKPMFVVVEADDAFGFPEASKEVRARYEDEHVPVFPSFDMAVKVMNSLKNYHDYLISPSADPEPA